MPAVAVSPSTVRVSLLTGFGQRHYTKKEIRKLLRQDPGSPERAEFEFHVVDCDRCVQRLGEVE